MLPEDDGLISVVITCYFAVPVWAQSWLDSLPVTYAESACASAKLVLFASEGPTSLMRVAARTTASEFWPHSL